MSSEKSTFWSRVGLWFRHPSRMADGFEDPADVLVDGTLTESGGSNSLPTVGESGGRLASRFRLGSRESALERLEEGYGKVIQLIESMQRHMAIQEDRSAIMARSLTELAETLSHEPEAAAKSHTLMASLADRAESQTVCLRRLEESLSQLPDLADAQRETMTVVSHQLDGVRQTTEQVTVTLGDFRGAVEMLGEATKESTAALARLHADSTSREGRLIEALHEQTKRFTVFSMIAVCVAVIASVISLVALLRGATG